MLKAVPAINAELRQEGHAIDDAEAGDVPVTTTRVKKSEKKANIEATSDEDSE